MVQTKSSAAASLAPELAFDPVTVLLQDAISLEPPELVYDFIDRLLVTTQLPLTTESLKRAASPTDFGAASSKRTKRVDSSISLASQLSSPVSIMDHHDIELAPLSKQNSLGLSSRSSESPRDSPRPSPPRSGSHSAHNGQGLSRKNRPQRCSICKETGHKSRTCRFAQGGKVDLRPGSPVGFGAIALQTAAF